METGCTGALSESQSASASIPLSSATPPLPPKKRKQGAHACTI